MHVVILAGGSGSRLWPWSRQNYPKQLLKIKEREGSLFQETVLRLKGLIPPEKIIVVTNKDQADDLQYQFSQVTQEKGVFLNEPASRNTAPAIGLAAFFLGKKNPDAVVAVLPSDHYIAPREKFLSLLKEAGNAAEKHGLVTFGITPDRPETGYGYIKAGQALSGSLCRVDSFVEKPDRERAKKYVKDANYLWNSGMFVFRAGDMIGEYKTHLPEMAELLEQIDYDSFSNLDEIYGKIEGISIDYGIMERSRRVAVIKADMNWNDVGDWQAIYKLLPRDEQGNHKKGNIYALDTRDSLLLGDKRVVGVIGLKNLILVDTPDALLVCSREKSQEVKKMVDCLKQNRAPEYSEQLFRTEFAEKKSDVQKWLKEGKNEGWVQNYSRWISDPERRKAIEGEMDKIADREELEDRFKKNLEFGTGGLRGKMGAGTNRMNIFMVRRTTQGLAEYLNKKNTGEDISVAIGYDTRELSGEFAREVAGVLAANKIKVFLFEEPQPTPVLSYAIRKLGCAAGIVITASHNPPEYNGYKIYDQNGAQIVPRYAEKISKEIDKNGEVKVLSFKESLARGLTEMIGEEIVADYVEDVLILLGREGKGHQDLKIVFTPLHGAANNMVRRVLRAGGFLEVVTVSEQTIPDPTFPTIKTPNPEAEEVYSMGIEKAREVDADIILATDPDGDRIGCMEKDSSGNFVFLSGNQIGALLLDYYLGELEKQKRLPSNGAIIKTIVTGELGSKVAAGFGMVTVDTLTGFKFIGEKIQQFGEKGEHSFLFGYEESCGYLAGTFVRDKDAVIASLLIARMTAFNYQERGLSLQERLDELYKENGYYYEDLITLNLEGKRGEQKKKTLMKKFRDLDIRHKKMTGERIVEKRDYKTGKGYNLLEGREFPLKLPVSDTLFFQLESGSWFCIRPSGTEAKLKFYFSRRAVEKEEAHKGLIALKERVMGIARS